MVNAADIHAVIGLPSPSIMRNCGGGYGLRGFGEFVCSCFGDNHLRSPVVVQALPPVHVIDISYQSVTGQVISSGFAK
jgi:hypothetical protein